MNSFIIAVQKLFCLVTCFAPGWSDGQSSCKDVRWTIYNGWALHATHKVEVHSLFSQVLVRDGDGEAVLAFPLPFHPSACLPSLVLWLSHVPVTTVQIMQYIFLSSEEAKVKALRDLIAFQIKSAAITSIRVIGMQILALEGGLAFRQLPQVSALPACIRISLLACVKQPPFVTPCFRATTPLVPWQHKACAALLNL